MTAQSKDMNRRTAMKHMAAAGLGLAAAGSHGASLAATTSNAARLDLSTPKDRLRAFLMMRGALDDRLVIGFLSGRYYGVVDAEMTPLYGVVSATFSRYRPLPDGGYQMASFEQAYFTDLDTGVVMDQWRNPYTGQTVSVPVTSSRPSKTIIAPDLTFVHSAIPGFHSEHMVLPVEQSGEDVVFTEQTRAVIEPKPPATKPFRYNELTAIRADIKDLNTPGLNRVPTTTTFTALVAWRPWQLMGDRPGHLMAQGSGRYGAEIPMLPQAWLEATRRVQPDLITNPGKALETIWNA